MTPGVTKAAFSLVRCICFSVQLKVAQTGSNVREDLFDNHGKLSKFLNCCFGLCTDLHDIRTSSFGSYISQICHFFLRKSYSHGNQHFCTADGRQHSPLLKDFSVLQITDFLPTESVIALALTTKDLYHSQALQNVWKPAIRNFPGRCPHWIAGFSPVWIYCAFCKRLHSRRTTPKITKDWSD